MTRSHRIIAAGLVAPLIAAILVLTACATARKTGITDATLGERIAQASTPADHESLALYFDEQATAAERKSEECRQLRKRYERTPQSVFYGFGTAPSLLSHYEELIRSHRRNAESYRALAAWHRQAGREAGSNVADRP